MTTEREDASSAGAAEPLADLEKRLLKEYLTAANKVALRLQWSLERVDFLMPLDAASMDALSNEDEEKLDALLQRFNSLTAMIQDHITRALLKIEEEDLKDRSRRDQRLLMEKLGVFDPSLRFADVAELRNRVAHTYPDDAAKQAEILTAIHQRGSDLLAAYNAALAYSDVKFFGGSLDVDPIVAAPGLTIR